MRRALCLYIPFLSTDRLRNLHSVEGKEHARTVRECGTQQEHVHAARGQGTPPSSGWHGAAPAAPWPLPPGTRVASLAGSRIDPCHPSATTDCVRVATVEPYAQTLRIVHVNQAAYELRVRVGQTLADAKAVAPDLVVYADDPAADRRYLEILAVWTDCLSPTVHIEGDDSLIVDVTGCERLFKGEERLLHRAIDGVNAQGFTVRGAVADTLGGAWALAHAHPEPAVISPPGQIAADLVPLPAWSLRIDDRTVADLASVGVETVGSLLHLPRSSLASRFGDGLLDRIDQALGDVPEVLTPYRPPPVLSSRIHFGAGTTRIDVLREGIRRALAEFCEELSRQVAGVRQMFATFYCPDGASEACDTSLLPEAPHGPEPAAQASPTSLRRSVASSLCSVTLPLSLSQPTRSVKHLYSLLMMLLDRLHLPAPTDSLALWATQVDPLDDRQEELFATGSGDSLKEGTGSAARSVHEIDNSGPDGACPLFQHGRAGGLGELVDRLAVRLGPQAVVRPELLSEHQPERAFRYVPVVGLGPGGVARKRDEGKRSDGATERRSDEGTRPISTATVMERSGQRRRDGGTEGRRAERSEVRLRRNGGTEDEGARAGARPLRLLPHPERVTVTAIVPEGPPVAFRLRGMQHAVADSAGPERLETGWWRGPHLKRDYYRVMTEEGCRAWLFRERETGDWFLHGWFD